MKILDEYRAIVDELHTKTLRGQVEWRTTVNAREFLVYFEKFALSIRDGSEDGSDFIFFSLKNVQGKNIDHFVIDYNDVQFDKAQELHAAARRKANHVDIAIRSIVDELKTKPTIGEKPAEDDDEPPF